MTRRVMGRTCGAVTVLSILFTGSGTILGADSAAAAEATVIFDNTDANGGLNTSGASPGSQSDTIIPFEAGAADDFTLPDSPLCRWSVTGVRWTGVYWDTWPGAITVFRVIIWPDDGGYPAGGGATPNLAEALKIYEIPGNAAETERGGGVFDYQATLPEPFEASPGIPYWIQIQAVMDYPPQWGWHLTANRQGAGPVGYFDMLRTPAWTPIADTGDLAFSLLGSPTDLACDDGDACTTDSCVAGQCVFEPMTCDDGDVCTEDSCSPEQGCVFATLSCDDGDACTTDTCDPVTGCTHENVQCDDGNACTEDSCSPEGGCIFRAIACDDGDACTTDTCDPVTGCAHEAVQCDDGNPCTEDSCSPEQGCVFSPITCDDGDACTTDTCDPASGCAHESVQCDDGNACTADTCDPTSGCVTQELFCDDGDACTTDTCDPATGCTHESVSCDDGNACTADTCDPTTGCVTQELFCDDGDVCTEDSCDPQTGCTSTPISCDDQDACTIDSCDPSGGCVHTPMDCEDGDVCTVDLCAEGTCVHVPPPDFDGDGMIGPADFSYVASCIGGPTVTVAASTCSCADLNGDGRVDLGDYAVLQMHYSGNKP